VRQTGRFLPLNLFRQLNWEEENVTKGAEKRARTLVLRNMFTQTELEKEPELMFDLKDDVKQECEKYGEVTTVKLFDVSPPCVRLLEKKTTILT
jgi:HIV Tat-specific factor 1